MKDYSRRCLNCCLSQVKDTSKNGLFCYKHEKYVGSNDICDDFEEYNDDMSNLGEYLKYKGEQDG